MYDDARGGITTTPTNNAVRQKFVLRKTPIGSVAASVPGDRVDLSSVHNDVPVSILTPTSHPSNDQENLDQDFKRLKELEETDSNEIAARVNNVQPLPSLNTEEEEEELVDSTPPTSTNGQKSIEGYMLDPDIYSYSVPVNRGGGDDGSAASGMLRADGILYTQQEPRKRKYENQPNLYDKEWIQKKIEGKRALSKDPLYYCAIQVAGRTGRTVLDLIEDPFQYAQPPMVARQDPRQTVKGALAVDEGTGKISSLAWLPANYARSKILDKLPNPYKAQYIAAANTNNKSSALAAMLKGLTVWWNSYMRRFENEPTYGFHLPQEIPPGTPVNKPEAAIYFRLMADERLKFRQRLERDLDFLSKKPFLTFTQEDLQRTLSLRQDIAELKITEEKRWIEGDYESLPGYDLLKTLFEKTPVANMVSVLGQWDEVFNNGLIMKQRLALQAEELKLRKNGGRDRQMEEELKRLRTEEPKPAVNLKWMALPENIGVIFPRENFQAALDRSLSDIIGFCGKDSVTAWDLITSEDVQSFFFDLIAANLLLYENYAPRRGNMPAKLPRDLRQWRFELLLKFTTLHESLDGSGVLYFSGDTNLLKAGIRRAREAVIKRQRGLGGGVDPSPMMITSSRGDNAVYEPGADYKRDLLPTKREQDEFDKSREAFQLLM